MSGLLAVAVVVVTTMAAFPSSAEPAPPPQALDIGVTHTQIGPDQWKPVESTDRAKQHLRDVTDLGNQHIMGFGALNPAPSPDVRDWTSLDARMHLLDSTGLPAVITLCCAPDWMKGGEAGRTDWSRLEVAPLPEYFDDFARLAVEVAQRYPQVRHFVVWNEFKGFAEESLNRWDYESYTALYNEVYRALKTLDPTIAVGGPYVPMDIWSDATTMSHPSAVAGPWGVVDQRALDTVEYWLAHAEGADFLAVDGHSTTKDAGLITTPDVANDVFGVVTRWLTARSELPVWWMEIYPEAGRAESWSSPYRADVALDALLTLGDAGAAAAFLWQPEGSAAFTSVGLWDSTDTPDGGRPQPLVDRLRWVRETWSTGRPVHWYWDGRTLVLATATVQ